VMVRVIDSVAMVFSLSWIGIQLAVSKSGACRVKNARNSQCLIQFWNVVPTG
jgi:hypothetical protein